MWWTDGSRSDDGRVGAAAVCKHRDGWRGFCSHLGSGRMEFYDVELCAIGLALQESLKKRDTADTQSNEGSRLQRLTSCHSTNGAPGTWARAAPSQVD